MSSPPTLKMTLAVYEAIRTSIGRLPAEVGGMLGGHFDKNEITKFFHDKNATRSAAAYSPDSTTINNLLTNEWNPTGIRLVGFVHSHPAGLHYPSRGDKIYAERILGHNTDIPFLALPIVQSERDAGQFQIRMFVAQRHAHSIKIHRIPFMIVAGSDEDCGYCDETTKRQTVSRKHFFIPPNKTGVAEKTNRAIKENGGITVNIDGDEPTHGFSYAPNKSTETRIDPEDFTVADVENFVVKHWKALNEPGAYIGGWQDANGVPILDVARVSDDKLRALLRAREAQQTAIHDLSTHQDLNVKDGLAQYTQEQIAEAKRQIVAEKGRIPILNKTPARRDTSAICPQTACKDETCGNGHPLVAVENPDAGPSLHPSGGQVAVRRGTARRSSAFARVESVYDLNHLAGCRLIYIGIGGAASFAEDMTRAGVGEHVIIDPDVVSETNLATQQVYLKDIGRAKVATVAERICQVNGEASVIALRKSLDDFSDKAFRELLFTQMPDKPSPKDILVCGLTDSFEAQARVNRIGLNFGLPTLCAQVYAEGRAAEVTFTYPGVTPACHRCVLSSRYDAYLRNGYENDVTSNGTPIFATTRLNALKGFIALAILHHGRSHPRWGNMLTRIGNRNLIQIRLDPDLASTLGLQNFEQAFADANPDQLFFDETIWRPQVQECPLTGYAVACPDCGGTGDLRFAIARFADTRLMAGENQSRKS